ncbi:hypothetical protein [Pararobbsia alpina]|uniref:Uncharacterized protein n=1 Tax=Pararobbsia alpina TaxID=621374 RepID=A0A6S7BE27_9BURK|nr:hypothetical protein [Pararobbsia alpina]CAB3796300.1 hypothetical protein LMG28138_04044 [Pararobbsia alpina]
METTPWAERDPLREQTSNDAGPDPTAQEKHVIAKVSRHLL